MIVENQLTMREGREKLTRVSQKFCNILVVREAQFSRFWCFHWGCEGDQPG